MSNSIVRTSAAKLSAPDAIGSATQERACDVRLEALVAELRQVRSNVDALLRASELAHLKSSRTAA